LRSSQVIGPFFVLAALVAAAVGQSPTPVTIGQSETLFAVLAAINNCGYDAELASADPVREKVRDEVGRNLEASEDAKNAANSVCNFYRDHQQVDATHTLSQYVSLAMYMNPAPAFTPKVKEADLPPDASGVLGLVPLVQKFYAQAGIHDIWQRHQQDYAELSSRYHEALASMIRDTELYLRLPSGSYAGRTFTIYVEPMGAPSEVNARSYGDNYYVVITPGAKAGLKMDQIHHAYLHFLLDSQVGKFAGNLTTLDPILDAVKLAPMDESYKADPDRKSVV